MEAWIGWVPSKREWINILGNSGEGKVKGLIKCHTSSIIRNGQEKKPYRFCWQEQTPLCSHYLNLSRKESATSSHSFRDTKHILQIIMRLNRHWANFGKIPATTKQVACDVVKLYPSVENTNGLEDLLDTYPNPEGLPKDLLMEGLKICLEQNICDLCRRFFFYAKSWHSNGSLSCMWLCRLFYEYSRRKTCRNYGIWRNCAYRVPNF